MTYTRAQMHFSASIVGPRVRVISSGLGAVAFTHGAISGSLESLT